MNHCGTRQLETNRLILREFAKEDAAAMYRNWASDESVTRYLTWPAHASQQVSQSVIEDWINSYTDKSYYQWAIVPKDNRDEPIGSISVVHMEENASVVEVGYCIGKAWWHKGITPEALAAVMDYLFDTVGAERIEAKHDPRNPNSGKVMKKCRMKYEGTLHNSDRNNQGICDACRYALEKSQRRQSPASAVQPLQKENESHGT
nr:GNAT family N-acetyltransferase [Parablautia intestinalis]